MWPWEPKVKSSRKCSVALFTLIVGLSDKAQLIDKAVTSNSCFTHWRPKETNLHKWSKISQREIFYTNSVFSIPLKHIIKSHPYEILQIIVTKDWQNKTIIEGTHYYKTRLLFQHPLHYMSFTTMKSDWENARNSML